MCVQAFLNNMLGMYNIAEQLLEVMINTNNTKPI